MMMTNVPATQHALCIQSINQTLCALPQDPRAQWICADHIDAKQECVLWLREGGQAKSIVIDRTFIDRQGQRWIIDYKTQAHLAKKPDARFYQTVKKQHAKQLQTYLMAYAELEPKRQIQVGIYFPQNQGWCNYPIESNILLYS